MNMVYKAIPWPVICLSILFIYHSINECISFQSLNYYNFIHKNQKRLSINYQSHGKLLTIYY